MGNSYLRIPMVWTQKAPRSEVRGSATILNEGDIPKQELLNEELFHNLLKLERRRAERSRDPFVLMLLDLGAPFEPKAVRQFMTRVATILLKTTRETDLVGWYSSGHIVGAIFTELNPEYLGTITEILQSKILTALREGLSSEVYSNLGVSLHLFPQASDQSDTDTSVDSRLYADVSKRETRRRVPLVAKRAVDILGSATILLLFSPILAAIALAVKLTSKGPVIFRQQRLGKFGKRFSCLKFRTMFSNNDPKVHQEYVEKFIAGQLASKKSESDAAPIYKITNDARVTTVGKFLRKTSLDEFPQFWNVLIGEMSLVGPRPPVPYEYRVYDIWHRRRVLEVKPGITGLWQVSGRSRTSFDEMVRLDLRYSQSWSLWLDLRILMATPRAVFGGEGAY